MKRHHLKLILRRYIVSLIALLLWVLSACGVQMGPTAQRDSTGAQSASTGVSKYTPVIIKSCGITFTYDQPPKRAVTLNQTATEVMLALGLEDRMVGTAYLDAPIPTEYQKTYAKIPVLAKQYPSRETLLGVEPDFVYAVAISGFSKEAVGSREELLSLGIKSYLSPVKCEQTELRPERVTMEDIYSEILDIGRIFGVQERSQKLVSVMREQLKQIQRQLGKVETRKRIFWYDSEDPPLTPACCGMPNHIIELAGGENIFQDIKGKKTWATVNWEDVITRNPDIIGLTDANWSKAHQKRQLLKSNPAFLKMKALQKEQFVVLEFNHIIPSTRNVEGVRRLAKALYPERFR